MGDRLEALMAERGLRQADLARRIGWSRQRLSLKMAADRWDADSICLIAQALDVPTDQLFFTKTTLPGKVHAS